MWHIGACGVPRDRFALGRDDLLNSWCDERRHHRCKCSADQRSSTSPKPVITLISAAARMRATSDIATVPSAWEANKWLRRSEEPFFDPILSVGRSRLEHTFDRCVGVDGDG
jgi:hypothetical protein